MPILECWRFISESTESTTSMGRSWYPLVNIQKAIENGHLSLFFPIKRWWFSIFFFQNVYQRVDPLGNSKDRHPCHSTFLCLRQHYCWVRAHSTIKHFSVLHDRSCLNVFFPSFFRVQLWPLFHLGQFPSPKKPAGWAATLTQYRVVPRWEMNCHWMVQYLAKLHIELWTFYTGWDWCPFLGICFTSPSTICWKSYPQ